MTHKSSPINTMLSTTISDIHEKPADAIEKQSLNNSKNDQNSIANVAVDDYAQSFETQRKNNYSDTSLCAQSFMGTTPTHKSLTRNFHTPVKKTSTKRGIFLFSNRW